MNKGKSKKKMNSYLKMVLIMLAGGVVGGIFGFVTSYSGENSIAVIGHGMNAFLLAGSYSAVGMYLRCNLYYDL